MPYTVISDFRLGLDARRSALTSPPGSLASLVNGHITAGGEIEKRKAWVRTALPSNCYGLESTVVDGVVRLTVFGSVAEGDLDAELPANVTYQQLTHPDTPAAVMAAVVHSCVYNGLAFVIADFGADGIVSFYDGTAVDDLSPGRLAAILADADALAAYFAGLIDELDDYTATATDGTVTITGPTGRTFSLLADNEGSVCTEPLDTDPPTVSGVTVTSLIVNASVTPDHGLTDNLYLYYDATPDGSTTGDSFVGTAVDTPVVWDVIAAVGAGVIKGGYELAFKVSTSGGDTYTTISIEADVVYGTTGTKHISLALSDFTLMAGPPAYYLAFVTLDADPLVSDPTIIPTLFSSGTAPVSGSIPQSQFDVTAVEASGTITIDNVIVDEGGANETELLDGAVTATADDPAATATAIAASIVAAGNNFTATAVNRTVVIRATANYATWNGKSVVVKTTGGIAIGKCALNFSLLPGSATLPTWDNLTVDGADILGSQVVGATSLTASVQSVADTINAYQAEYVAVAVNATLYLSKVNTSSKDQPLSVAVTGSNFLVTGDPGGYGGTGGGAGLITVVVTPSAAQGVMTISQKGFRKAEWETPELTSRVSGGLPPYSYQWQFTDGFTPSTAPLNFDATCEPLSPAAAASKFRFTANTNTPTVGAARKAQLRVVDNLNNVGLSQIVDVYL